MLQQFSQLYRRIGIRRLTDLMSPEGVMTLELPKHSVLHYLSDSAEVLEIDLSEPVYNQYTKKINLRWVTEYSQEPVGTVRKLTYNTVLLTNEWYKANRGRVTRINNGVPLTADDMTLEVLNYSHLRKAYVYQDTPLAQYHSFVNKYTTIFKTMAQFAESNSHEHFIQIHIGEDLLSKSVLDMYQDKINSSVLKIFDQEYKLLILEFWKWFNPSLRHTSLLNVFMVKDMPKITFVFTNAKNKSVYLSLAYLNSWIKGEEVLKDAGPATQLDFDVMQKAFLKFLISMNSFLDDEDVLQAPDNTPVPPNTTDEPGYDEQNDWDEMEDRSHGEVDIKATKPGQTTLTSVKDISESGNLDTESLDAKLKAMDEDIIAQDAKTKKVLASMDVVVDDKGEAVVQSTVLTYEEIQQKYLTVTDPITKLTEQVEILGDRKDVSAADYRTMLKRIKDSQLVASPYDDKTLLKDVKVSHEDLLLDEAKCKLAVTGASDIVDASMSRSTLASFTPDYVSKVMKKDILTMVMGVLPAGVLVKEYGVETTHSVLGSYEDHRIVLQPVQGVTSPLRIRLPVVDEDGTFLANGNKYSMRTQRVDAPIRKTGPITVALTSYYGKTFIGLSEKKAHSQTAWLVTKINQMGQTHPEVVKEVAYGTAYDNYNKAPFIYNSLAHNFRMLRINDVTLMFAKEDRETIGYPRAARPGYICGKTTDGSPVCVDDNNIFHAYSNKANAWIELGSIYKMLGISENDGPLDSASLNVFSKPVSVGVVLSYRMGLGNLLVLLQSKYGLQYQFVPGKRLTSMEENQYSIRFKDGFLVLDKCQQKAADLVMAGFKDFEKETKTYDRAEFDHKHVYLNLLKSKGMTTMYLNEVDNLMDMFVDPITRRILQEMKEPETFEGLLMRSSELLTNYEHPDSQDTAYQRLRGYERFAGVMYNEICNSIRAYKSKTNKNRAKIDMSPYQVWGTIMQDPANKLVEDINPIQNIKHQEIVTYVGVGGRDKGTINKKSRAYHKNDIGIIGEATVDSSDVGINVYMSCDPKLNNMYGIPNVGQQNAATSMLTSAAMLAPGSTNDD